MFKELMEKLKSEGVSIAEDQLVKIVRAVFKQLKEKASGELFDSLEAKVLAQVDKLDGEDDEGY